MIKPTLCHTLIPSINSALLANAFPKRVLGIRHISITAVMEKQNTGVRTVPLPKEGLLFGKEGLSNRSFSDSYALTLPNDAPLDAVTLARKTFESTTGWMKALMWLRDHTFAPFLRLKDASKIVKESKKSNLEVISFFPILAKSTDGKEVLLGADDSHLDFRVSAKVQQVKALTSNENAPPHELVLSTVVECHNWAGKAYLFIIKPFHIIIVKTYLRNLGKVLESPKQS